MSNLSAKVKDFILHESLKDTNPRKLIIWRYPNWD